MVMNHIHARKQRSKVRRFNSWNGIKRTHGETDTTEFITFVVLVAYTFPRAASGSGHRGVVKYAN